MEDGDCRSGRSGRSALGFGQRALQGRAQRVERRDNKREPLFHGLAAGLQRVCQVCQRQPGLFGLRQEVAQALHASLQPRRAAR